ncbi:MAG: hypothetical protein Q7U60_04930 [Candidatus Methanoperedens sp.]|nr:hypothetical protein [Candidatus Methanoperedens sp.]
MNKKILLYLALMAFSLYSIPNTVALFAGQHSFYSGAGVSCDTCHSDVLSQIQNSGYVYEKHKLAAGNTNYTTYLALGGKAYNGSAITDYNDKIWNWNSSARAWQNQSNPGELKNVSLDTSKNSGICMLCHNATLTGSTTHTGVIVRVCDDDRCHGNRNNSYNSPAIVGSTSNITAAGYNLSQASVHQSFYLEASNQSSGYATGLSFGQFPGNMNGSSGFISRGYWTCEGCHTAVAVNVTIIQAPAFNHSVGAPSAPKRYN